MITINSFIWKVLIMTSLIEHWCLKLSKMLLGMNTESWVLGPTKVDIVLPTEIQAMASGQSPVRIFTHSQTGLAIHCFGGRISMWLLRSNHNITHYFSMPVILDVYNRKVLLIIFSINIPSFSCWITLLKSWWGYFFQKVNTFPIRKKV